MENVQEFRVDNFLAAVTGKGLARENRFVVVIPEAAKAGPEDGKLVSLLCESTTIPQLALRNRTLMLQGPHYTRATGIDFGGASWTATFYVDHDFKVKQFFDRWMTAAVNPGKFTVNYHADYVRNIEIHQLDERDNIIASCKLIDAYPATQSALNLSQGAQNSFHKLAITFVYRYWDNDTIKNTINAATPFPRSDQKIVGWSDPPTVVSSGDDGYFYP